MSRKRAQLEFGQKLDIAERLKNKEDPHKLAEEFGCSIQSIWKARKMERKNRAIVKKWGGDERARKMTREPSHVWVQVSKKPMRHWTLPSAPSAAKTKKPVQAKQLAKQPAKQPAKQQARKNLTSTPATAPAPARTAAVAPVALTRSSPNQAPSLEESDGQEAAPRGRRAPRGEQQQQRQ